MGRSASSELTSVLRWLLVLSICVALVIGNAAYQSTPGGRA